MSNQSGPQEAEMPNKPTALTRACEPCRNKKIRCDRAYPCSQCAISNRKCFSILSDSKIKRRRPAQTLEQKIDALGTRLASIEQFFKSNATSSIEDDSSSDLYHGFASTTRPSSRESTFCGDTSIIAHSNFAHDYLEKELENRGLADRIPGLIESLRSLKSEIDRPEHREPSAPHSMFDTSKPITSQITLPSFEFVQKIITLSQERPIEYFWSVWPGMNLERYVDICRTTYFSLQEVSLTKIVLFYGFLSAFLLEYILQVQEKDSHDWLSCLALCHRSLDLCIQAIPMVMPRTCDSLNALSILAFHAMEAPDPWAACTSVASALEIAFSLGYHRFESMQKDTEDEKRQKMYSFWLLYCVEKGLSLRLARSSTIRDSDITLPDPNCLARDGFSRMVCIWIRLSSIQARVYDDLYSPSSFQSSQFVRTKSAEQLARELELVGSNYHLMHDTSRVDSPTLYSVMILSDLVTYYSTLSIILRTLNLPKNETGAPFSSRCTGAARQALIYHQKCAQIMRKQELFWQTHLHWSIINSPFTPFMIVFCNIIATSDSSDLQLLEVFTASLSSSVDQYPAVKRMHSLCLKLYEAAVLSADSRRRGARAASETELQPSGTLCEIVSVEKTTPYIRYDPSYTWDMMNTATSYAGDALSVSHIGNMTNENADKGFHNGQHTDVDCGTAMDHSYLWQIDQWQEGTQCLSEFLGEDLSFL